ncbi:MAG: diacylglycerol/lipid kinase family protein [Pseudomonadota bacterium]
MERLVLLAAGEVPRDLAAAADALGVALRQGGDLGALAQSVLAEGVDRLAVAGGDGSVNAVARAVASLPEGDVRPDLALVPTGTANDLATALGIPRDARRALELAIEGRSRPIDVGRVDDAVFVNALSLGAGAAATRSASPELKRLLGSLAYLVSGLVELGGATPRPVRLTTPDGTRDGDLLLLSICNSGHVGGVSLVPAAALDDGLLDLVALVDVRPGEPAARLAAVRELIEGGTAAANHVWRVRAARFVIEVLDDAPVTVNLDGEPGDRAGRLEVVVAPAALRVVVPR